MGRNIYTRTVDEFLAHAFDPEFEFMSEEEEDDQPRPFGNRREIGTTKSSWPKQEPGTLVRAVCEECGEEKDCWIDEHGNPEDPRDMWHVHPGGARGGGERWATHPTSD